MRAAVLLREAWASGRASRAYSLLFASIAFMVVLVVIVLIGQAQAQRASVAAGFNEPEFRTVTLTDEQGLGVVPWTMSTRATGLSTVDTAWVLGPAIDVTNGAFPDAGRWSAQTFAGNWDGGPISIVSGRPPRGASEAVIDEAGARRLGIDDSGGWAEGPAGEQWSIVGIYQRNHDRAPSALLVPADPAASPPPQSVSFTCVDVTAVDAATSAVVGLTDTTAPGQLSVARSADAGDLAEAISRTVNRYGSMIVLTVMATSLVTLAFLSVLMVHSRRQEFGRRRALGASRGAVVGLVVVQGALVVTAGSLLGLAAGTAISWLRFDVLVSGWFLLALLLTMVCGSALAQVPSAVAAGLRDPVRVLRTP